VDQAPANEPDIIDFANHEPDVPGPQAAEAQEEAKDDLFDIIDGDILAADDSQHIDDASEQQPSALFGFGDITVTNANPQSFYIDDSMDQGTAPDIDQVLSSSPIKPSDEVVGPQMLPQDDS